MTRTTPELPPLSAPHQRDDVWSPTYDLTCNMPTARLIFSGPLSLHLSTAAFRNFDSRPIPSVPSIFCIPGYSKVQAKLL
ncbi:hypothetical protein AVEN_88022-1 [Araneus ventricosus]|uniref:Uncharacterized protein n=1 Tax=Araneus ventricosus TaxID=182803 RepID=A0A4Y2H9Z1_ARAVE|nr:hypothetical protein AVEN_88022-1 [Araneus ventricosus]